MGAYVKYDLEHILRLQTALNFQIQVLLILLLEY